MKASINQGVGPVTVLSRRVGDTYVAAIRAHDVAARQQRSRHVELLTARHLGVSPGSVRLDRAPSGQPRFATPENAPHVSLAWRNDVLLVGLAPRPAGVDIERVGAVLEPPWNVLASEERDDLAAIEDPAARHEAFLRLWTVKEAALKALGTGLTQEPSALVVTFPNGEGRLVGDAGPLTTTTVRVEAVGEGSDRFVWACVVL